MKKLFGFIKDHKKEIVLGAMAVISAAATVKAVVMAKENIKAESKEIDKMEQQVEELKEAVDNGLVEADYTEDDYENDKMIVKGKRIISVIKNSVLPFVSGCITLLLVHKTHRCYKFNEFKKFVKNIYNNRIEIEVDIEPGKFNEVVSKVKETAESFLKSDKNQMSIHDLIASSVKEQEYTDEISEKFYKSIGWDKSRFGALGLQLSDMYTDENESSILFKFFPSHINL